jgi:ubiquinol oxidase
VVLETVAAVPGMVGATLNHLKCLRRMEDDKGWIKTLMDEAENERMHLMTFIEVAKPTLFERFVVVAAQWVFYLFFFGLYLVSSKTAHRVVGYFEEEAVISYTHYLAEIDEGRSRERAGAASGAGLLEPAGRRHPARRGRGGPRRRGSPPRRQPRLRQRTARPAAGPIAPCPPHVVLEPNWKTAA